MTEHLTHLLMLGVPLLAFVLILWGEWQRTSPAPLPLPVVVLGFTVLGTGVLHAGVIGHHLSESWVLGCFFAGLALVEIGLALALLFAPRARTLDAAVLVQAGTAGLWLWTRTVGVPFGIAGGVRQTVGALDVVCTVLEVGAVMLAYGVKREPWSKWLTSTTMNSPLLVKVSVPDGSLPSQLTQSLRPLRSSTLATRS
jgi:hypothetical protein